MKTINQTQIENILKQMIFERRQESLTARDALQIFEDFFFNFNIKGFPKDEDRDMALYQCGIYDWGEGEKFEVDFTRQLTFEENGEYIGMKQLNFTLYFDPKLTSKEVTFDIWYNPNEGKKKWIDAVTQSEGYKITQDITTSDFKIRYEDV